MEVLSLLLTYLKSNARIPTTSLNSLQYVVVGKRIIRFIDYRMTTFSLWLIFSVAQLRNTFAIEKQIDNYYDQMGTLVERSASTSGDTDLYDREIKKLCDKIEALRETLKTEQSNL